MTGFTITGGDYTGLGNPDGVAQAMCEQPGIDCGGALFVKRAALILHDCIVRDSIASRDDGQGGAIYLWETSFGRLVEIQHVQVISNSTSGAWGRGGGLYSYRVNGGIRIADSLFQDNVASGEGGGLYLFDSHSLVEIVGSSVISNSAGDTAGGVAVKLATNGDGLRMDRTIIQGNRANRHVGLYIFAAGYYEPRAHVTNVLLAGNRAHGSEVGASVAGIYAGLTPLSTTFAHVTAADNATPTFLKVEPSSTGNPTTITLINTLVVSFSNAFVLEEGDAGAMTLRHSHTLSSQVENLHVVLGGPVTTVATDQRTGDPMLDDTYHLMAGSAAVDAGGDAGVDHDVDNDARPLGRPDIGADEGFGRVYLPLVMRG